MQTNQSKKNQQKNNEKKLFDKKIDNTITCEVSLIDPVKIQGSTENMTEYESE